ncbi:hypothetical protein IJS77_05290 [bacterium]|nr:hypothetical protein [bacterium]
MTDKAKKEDIISSYWVERVVIITENYEITGNIYMPKSTKKSRLLSELLNGNRKFIAVKDCIMQTKMAGSMEPEYLDFLEINISSIILIKPYIGES